MVICLPFLLICLRLVDLPACLVDLPTRLVDLPTSTDLPTFLVDLPTRFWNFDLKTMRILHICVELRFFFFFLKFINLRMLCTWCFFFLFAYDFFWAIIQSKSVYRQIEPENRVGVVPKDFHHIWKCQILVSRHLGFFSKGVTL